MTRHQDARAIATISNQIKLRATEDLLTHFPFPEDRALRIPILLQLIERQFPIFAFPERLNLTPKELALIITSSEAQEGSLPFLCSELTDIFALLAFERAHPEGTSAPIGKTISKMIANAIRTNGDDLYFSREAVTHFPQLLDAFQEPYRGKIREAVEKFHPELLVYNIPYAMKQGIPFREIIRKSGEMYITPFSWYKQIAASVRRASPDHPAALTELNEASRELIENNPTLFLRTEARKILTQLFSHEQKQAFLKKHLSQ